MEAALNFPCKLRLNEAFAFVVWYSGERDGFVRDASGRLLAASTQEALTTAAGSQGLSFVSTELADYDFDRIRKWCITPDALGIDCADFLNAWNFFDDLARLSNGADTPYARLSRCAAACYDKLFWGCNLRAVTPPGECFDPDWRPDELTELRLVLNAGLEHLESELLAAEFR